MSGEATGRRRVDQGIAGEVRREPMKSGIMAD